MKLDKQLHIARLKANGQPTDQQLAAINLYALNELTADQVYVRTMVLAHNGIDRDGEVFDEGLLQAFADTLPGKGLFSKHPMSYDGDTGPGLGRIFEARLVRMSFDEARALLKTPDLRWPPATTEAVLLEAGFYMPRSEKNAGLIADIDAGVAADVSVGFRASDRTPITDESGRQIATRLLPPGEALEASLVWLGAQPGARMIKGADRSYQAPPPARRALRDPSVTERALAKRFGRQMAGNNKDELPLAYSDNGKVVRDPNATAKALRARFPDYRPTSSKENKQPGPVGDASVYQRALAKRFGR